MNHRAAIESIFMGRAFLRPLFYSYPIGLRFGLAEGCSAIHRFLTAHHKASQICSDIFANEHDLTVCLRVYCVHPSKFSYRGILRELSDAGIEIPRSRSIWIEEEPSLFVAFSAPLDLLPSLLWCALSSDFGVIRPRPLCTVYLFNLAAGIEVLPYDDRGMDVVGPNSQLLGKLYREHGAYLLDYDRRAMQATFDPE